MLRLFFILFLVVVSGCTTGNVILVEELVLEGPYEVVKVIDGDTLDLENGDRIRFSGINTPETGECHYQEAKDKLKELTFGKEVYLERDKSDEGKYGRKLRYVYLNESFMVNEYLVMEGFARVYDKYSYDTKRYKQLKRAEADAIISSIGVWSCEDPKENCLYVGSKNSDKYYLPECKYAKKIKPENLVCYNSEEEVEDLIPGNC